MSNEIDAKLLSEVEFLETLKESKYSVVFKVRFQERICVMKVVSILSYLLASFLLMIKVS